MRFWTFSFWLLAGLTGLPISAQPPANPDYQTGFPANLDGDLVRSGSVALGDLTSDGVSEIVVGAIDGQVHAYTGFGAELWTFDTGEMAIESKPAIADIDGDGFPEVVVSAGSTFTPNAHGGVYVLDHLGGLQCEFMTDDLIGAGGFRDGVYASPSVGDLDGNDGGRLEIAFGAWDFKIRVINDDCSLVWEEFVHDTVWATSAIGDVDGDGNLDVVSPSDSGPDAGGGTDGGRMFVFDGATGDEHPGWPIQIDEVIWSSPALADVDGDGRLEIFAGTGFCWATAACAPNGEVNPNAGEFVNGWDDDGSNLPGWPVAIPGRHAFGSPALADLDEDGELEVIINSVDRVQMPENGLTHAFNLDGSSVPGWPATPLTPTLGAPQQFSSNASPIVADLTGDGHLEVILPSVWELVVWDKDGNQLSRDQFPPAPGQLELRAERTINGSAAVGDIDGDGDLEVVAAGSRTGGSPGAIYAWDFAVAADGRLQTVWPQFRRTADNNGIAEVPLFIDGFESGDVSSWN